MTGVVLNPLTQIRIGMLVPIMIGCCEIMVDSQRGGKRGQCQ